jgi:gliding motility-associated-like protein
LGLIKLFDLVNKIYNPLYKLIFLLGIFAHSYQATAQVAYRDSLALVDLYNVSGGAAWTNHTHWLSGNVPTWYGVTVLSDKVSQINLPANHLTGPASDSLANLTALIKIDFSNDSLTSFPALAGLSLDSLLLPGNALTFKYLVPNRSAATTFVYTPQDSVDVYMDSTVVEQSSFSIHAMVDYNPQIGDTYHWFLDSISLVSSGANSYSIVCVDSADGGSYGCAITNMQLPALTLYRRPTVLSIAPLANPGQNFSVCDSISTLMAVAAPMGGSAIWSKVSGAATIASPDSSVTAVTGLSIGPNIFNYAVSAGNVSCPAGTYSNTLLVVTRDTNPAPAYAGPDQSICGGQAILSADSPSVGIGAWSVIKGTSLEEQPNNPLSAVNFLSPGQNILRWQIVNGACAPSFFDEVIIYRDDTLVNVSAGRDTSICPTTYTLLSTLPADAQGVWSVVTGSGMFSPDSTPQIFYNDTTIRTPVSELSEYLNTLQWTVSNSCNAISANVNVTVYQFTVANAGPDKQVYYTPISSYLLADSLATASGGDGQYSYIWSPSTNLNNDTSAHPAFLTPDSGMFSYSVTVTDGNGCSASADVNLHAVIPVFLVVPTLFTPNGDGVNDVLYIPGAESYPDNELIVVDRNNQVVYQKKGYRNDWGGTNEFGYSQVGQRLSQDTYFYTLKLADGRIPQTGFFLIKY